jgi:hypothetical protein
MSSDPTPRDRQPTDIEIRPAMTTDRGDFIGALARILAEVDARYEAADNDTEQKTAERGKHAAADCRPQTARETSN